MSFKKQIGSTESSDVAAYRDQDAQQFDALNQQINSRQPYTSHNETEVEATVEQANDHRFTYSENDAAHFQKILPKVKSTKQTKKSREEGTHKNGFENTYKQSDDEQFHALMNFTDSQSTSTNTTRAISTIDERSFAYSEQDRKAFNQLTPGDKASTSEAAPQTANHAERDVGHIKIMEFDGKKDKARSTPRQSNLNIKVRYFD